MPDPGERKPFTSDRERMSVYDRIREILSDVDGGFPPQEPEEREKAGQGLVRGTARLPRLRCVLPRPEKVCPRCRREPLTTTGNQIGRDGDGRNSEHGKPGGSRRVAGLFALAEKQGAWLFRGGAHAPGAVVE